MRPWPAKGAAAADITEVGLTSAAAPFTRDVTTAVVVLTCPAQSQYTPSRGRRHVEASTAERLTVPQRLEPLAPTATTTAAATAMPTAIAFVPINICIDPRREGGVANDT